MRHVLIDKQGNFGSIAGLPPAAMRYTEARLSPSPPRCWPTSKLDTVDFIPNYDERRTGADRPAVASSPTCWSTARDGIAVGMATSIPPHNLREVCDALIRVIDDPDVSLDELLEIVPGPDFPTGGIICGRAGIRRGYRTGRGNDHAPRPGARSRKRKKDRTASSSARSPTSRPATASMERIAELVERRADQGHLRRPRRQRPARSRCRIVIDLKRDADPDVVLNQLYQFSPLQDTFSIILLALVDGKPRTLHAQGDARGVPPAPRDGHPPPHAVPARARPAAASTPSKACSSPVANIDEVIRIIRASPTQAEAKERLHGRSRRPAAMLQRALGAEGFAQSSARSSACAEAYSLTAGAGRRDPPHAARPARHPRAREARRRVPRAARGDRRATSGSSSDEANILRHHPRRPARAAQEVRRRPPHRDHRRGDRRRSTWRT